MMHAYSGVYNIWWDQALHMVLSLFQFNERQLKQISPSSDTMHQLVRLGIACHPLASEGW